MLISGWDIDLADTGTNRSRTQDARVYLFESPQSNFAALLYDVTEYRMGVECGLLAVFKVKSRPRLLVAPKIRWFASPHGVSWISSTEFAVCTMQPKEVPIVIFNVADERFSFIHVPRGDLYDVRLEGDTVVLMPRRPDDTSLPRLDRHHQSLQWFSMAHVADFDEAYRTSANVSGVPQPSRTKRAGEILQWLFGGAVYLLFWLIFWPFFALDWVKARLTNRGVDH